MVATQVDTLDSRRADLHAAFCMFGSASSQLSDAFDALRAQVATLGRELAEARSRTDHLAARLSSLITGLPGGVLLLDGCGDVMESNPAAGDLLGACLQGQRFDRLIERAAKGRMGGACELIELHCGRFVNISRSVLPQGGEIVLLTDVTESHVMQRHLQRQQRLLTMGELAAGLAHQIRTPLAAALLYASQMALPQRAAAAQLKAAEKTVLSLKQLDRLVTDMLAFAHGGAVRERVSVSALLEQVAQWLRPALRRGVRLTIGTQAPELAVRATAAPLVSAVLNLANNALQAARGDLNLQLLACRGPQGHAQIFVSDDGPGIPAAIRERIFEPFFTTRPQGNGIGLSIVRSVVEAHGGNVRLMDQGPGATFMIELPAED